MPDTKLSNASRDRWLSTLAASAIFAVFAAQLAFVVAHVLSERQVAGRFAGHDLLFGGLFAAITLYWGLLAAQSVRGSSSQSLPDKAASNPGRVLVWRVFVPIALLFAVRLFTHQLPAVHIGIKSLFVLGGPEAAFLLYGSWLVWVLGADVLSQMVARVWQPFAARLGQSTIERALRSRLALLVVGGLLLLLLAYILQTRAWQQPLRDDLSQYIYLGRVVYEGGLPYRDLVEFHPPAHHSVNVLWALVSDVTGVSLLAVFYAYQFMLGGVLLTTVYHIGRDLTDRRAGGLYAVLFLFGLRSFNDIMSHNMHLKATVTLLLLLAIMWAQRQQWVRATLVAFFAMLMWLPAGVGLALVGLVALLQGGRAARRAVLKVVIAGAGALAVTLVVLFATGLADEVYRQVISATFNYTRTGAAAGSSTGSGNVGQRLDLLLSAYTTGDWGLLALTLAGVAALARRASAKRLLTTPRFAAPLLGASLLFALIALDFQGFPDTFLSLAALAPLGAACVFYVHERLATAPARASLPVAILLGGLLLMYGLSDVNYEARYLSATQSLRGQHQMTAQLDDALGPDDIVLDIGEPWFALLSGRESPTRVPVIGPKALLAAQAEGITPDDIVAEWDAINPVVVMAPNSRLFDSALVWLDENYDYAGSYLGRGVYVRKGEDSIAHMVAGWPLRH